MLVFGHKNIPSCTFAKIDSIEEIKLSKPNSIATFEYTQDVYALVEYCQKNSIDFALLCSTKKEIIFSENLGARFIVVKKEISKEAQKIADDYLFSSKILVLIDSEDEIEDIANDAIDGVLFRDSF